MADLKRKQLRQFLSGSFNITGSLNVTGSVEFDKNISGSITSTGSFSRLQSDTISVTHSPFASGSGVQALMDATGSYASASTQYVKESQTGSFPAFRDSQPRSHYASRGIVVGSSGQSEHLQRRSDQPLRWREERQRLRTTW